MTNFRSLLTLTCGVMGLWGCASSPTATDTSAANWLEEHHQLTVDLALAEQERRQQIDTLLQQQLDLPAAMTLFLVNSPRVRAELATLGIAQAERVQAGLLTNPALMIGALRPEGGGRWQLDAGISQSLLNIFTRPLRVQLAEAELGQAKLALYKGLNTQLYQVQTAYWQLVAAKHLQQVQRQQLQAAEANVSLAQSLLQAGNIPEATLLEFQLSLQAQKRSLLRARMQVEQAEIGFANLLGLNAATPLKLPQRLPLPPLPPSDNFSLPALYQTALDQRLDLQLALAQVQFAHNNLALQKHTGTFTEVDLGAQFERETDGSYLAGPELSLSLPLFDRGHARTWRAETTITRAQAQVEILERQIEADIATAVTAIGTARQTYEQLRQIDLPLQQKLQELTLREYNFMLTSPFELLRLKQEELALQRESVMALLAYWQARSDLALAGGTSLTIEAVNIAPSLQTPEDPSAQHDHPSHQNAEQQHSSPGQPAKDQPVHDHSSPNHSSQKHPSHNHSSHNHLSHDHGGHHHD